MVTTTKGNKNTATRTSNTPSNTSVIKAGSPPTSVLKVVDQTSSPSTDKVKDPKQEIDAQRISTWTEKQIPTLAELKSAIELVKNGYLSSIRCLVLKYLNISDISTDELKMIASIVTESVVLWNVSHTNQLSNIFASVNCQTVTLKKTKLTPKETEDLVTAMRNCVGKIEFGWEVSFDIHEFCSYWETGNGKCQMMKLSGDTRITYGDNIKDAAEAVGWTVSKDKNGILILRKS